MVPLPNGGQLSHAAIVGQDGGVWAQDAGFPAITVEETQALVKGCNDTSTPHRLYIAVVSVHRLCCCFLVFEGATRVLCSEVISAPNDIIADASLWLQRGDTEALDRLASS